MDKYELPVELFLIIPLIVLPKPIGADPLYTDCSAANNYTLNSTFENNLKLLFQTLTSKTPLTGFYNNSIGGGPDRVHGQALCRGDLNAKACQDCVKSARQVLEICKSKDAMIWYESCQVRYSYRMFFSTQVYTGKYVDWEAQRQNVSKPVHFNEVLMYLLNNISNEAAFNPVKKMFSTGEVKFSKKVTIYGLVQCTRDINGGDCLNCLNEAFGDLRGCCYSTEGGIIVSRNCNVRYEIYSFYNASRNLLTYPTSKGDRWEVWMIALNVCIPIVILAVLIGSCILYKCRERGQTEDGEKGQIALLQELVTPKGISMTEACDLMSSEELPIFDLAIIEAATDNFSGSNKLGQGGFGTVYKGVLPDGKEIAVKRLSKKSWQGLEEFKNEIILIAKLQHRNLVRLLGCGLGGEEKLLVYEFMPNKSLDVFIFDSERRAQLDWKTCYNIIGGIAKGLLYLHEDSRLKIIHRDLKPNNVLLDQEMVAKISDFGMARIFGENQNTANTRRVAGTFGYMAPEYAMEGLFSVKSDVFSFGVIMLEFLSGKKNSGFYITELAPTLLAYAWRLWNEGKEAEFIDPLLIERSPREELIRCMHIGLLCVQQDPEDRPTMSSVVVLLESEPVVLPEPKKPAFSVGRMVPLPISVHLATDPSVNQITDCIISPR
ncbi:cysteine-rich receptor-like protein kinase 15 [Jatropha curcas]|nr:cysteine-rich receptor-like protein kinase 15 [Jatropha curcas]